MTTDQQFIMARAMQMYGSTFEKMAGKMIFAAGVHQTERLLEAFPEFEAEFGPDSVLYKMVNEQHKEN